MAWTRDSLQLRSGEELLGGPCPIVVDALAIVLSAIQAAIAQFIHLHLPTTDAAKWNDLMLSMMKLGPGLAHGWTYRDAANICIR